jgi:hypothetical protein
MLDSEGRDSEGRNFEEQDSQEWYYEEWDLEGRTLFIFLLASKSFARKEKTNYLNKIKPV